MLQSVELYHEGIKEDTIIRSSFPHQYLTPVGKKLCQKLG